MSLTPIVVMPVDENAMLTKASGIREISSSSGIAVMLGAKDLRFALNAVPLLIWKKKNISIFFFIPTLEEWRVNSWLKINRLVTHRMSHWMLLRLRPAAEAA